MSEESEVYAKEFTFYAQAESCYIIVLGLGRVQIKKENEGIVVDIFPLADAEESVASTYAFTSELLPENELFGIETRKEVDDV